jgi:secreted Zn-dependent insulinase-like peptidase
VIQDRVVEAEENPMVADLLAEAVRALMILAVRKPSHDHAMIVTTPSQDDLQNSQEKETIRKIFQNQEAVKRLAVQEVNLQDFPREAISLTHAHAMIVTIQNQDVPRSFQERKAIISSQNLAEEKLLADREMKDLHLAVINRTHAHVMIEAIQNLAGQEMKGFLLAVISPIHAHAMIVMIQSQDALQSSQTILVAINPILDRVMIAMIQNLGVRQSLKEIRITNHHARGHSTVMISPLTKKDFSQN